MPAGDLHGVAAVMSELRALYRRPFLAYSQPGIRKALTFWPKIVSCYCRLGASILALAPDLLATISLAPAPMRLPVSALGAGMDHGGSPGDVGPPRRRAVLPASLR